MLRRALDWLSELRDIWADLNEIEAQANTPGMYYGRLGEMGHPDDRAHDWPPAGTGI